MQDKELQFEHDLFHFNDISETIGLSENLLLLFILLLIC